MLTFFWVASDADQGFSQRIFYIHVPIALTSYVFFGVGAFYAARYLLRRNPDDDLKSYVALHIGIIFGTLVLLTGPIWAKVSWGHWWNWSDEQLNVFLILFLFYSAYFMLRFSLDPGPQRAAYSSAYALLGIGLVPLSFVAVHLAKSLIHPVGLHLERPADGQPHARRRSSCGGRASCPSASRCSSSRWPASASTCDCAACARSWRADVLVADITLSTAVKYVAAAYAVVWLLVLLYVWILRSKYQRLEGEVVALEARLAERSEPVAEPERITVT